MDKLKEHKLLVTMVAGVVVALGIFFVLSSSAMSATDEAMKRIDPKQIDTLRRAAEAAPSKGAIESKNDLRIARLREVYECYLTYIRWSYPLRHHRIPGTETSNSGTVFTGQFGAQIARLKQFYEEFKKAPTIPAGVTAQSTIDASRDPFSAISQQQFSDADVPRGQKQFWVLVELINTLHAAVQTVEGNRRLTGASDPKPVCLIDQIAFEGGSGAFGADRQQGNELGGMDVSGVILGIPFRMDLYVDIEVWPHFRTLLHTPAPIVPGPPSGDIVRGRRGIRFDRVSFEVQLRNVIDRLQIDLGTPGQPNQELVDFIKQLYPQVEVFNGRIVPPPGTPDRERFMDEMRRNVGTQWAARAVPGSNFVYVTVRGEALDFVPDLNRVNFWKNLDLSVEDIKAILDRGENQPFYGPDDPNEPLPYAQLEDKAKEIYTRFVGPLEGGR